MEENAPSPGPPFTATVTIQATWEPPVTTVSRPTYNFHLYYVHIVVTVVIRHFVEFSWAELADFNLGLVL